MEIEKAGEALLGLVVMGIGVLIMFGSIPTAIGPVFGFAIFAFGLAILGYAGLWKWFKNVCIDCWKKIS
jgi:hypothetical protein